MILTIKFYIKIIIRIIHKIKTLKISIKQIKILFKTMNFYKI